MIDTGEQKKVQYRLRRIGRPATKSSVKNIMKLNGDVTRFGRHSGNDYYLDSAKLECFISRWHAEIHRVPQNGKFHFVLKDTSLNGTYVNNYRVLGNHRLKNGEVICFGHTNGKNLKPGDYAPQTDSEFEFVFEEYVPDEVEDTGNNILQPQNHINHPTVDSTTDIHSSLSYSASVALCKPAGSHSVPATCMYNVTSSKAEPVRSPSTLKSSNSSSASSPVLQDVSNKSTSSNTTGLVPLEQYASQSGNGGHPSAPCNITVHVKQDIKSPLHSQQQAATATAVFQDTKVSREDKSTLDLANSSPVHESVTQSKSSQSIKSSGKKRKTSQTSSTGSGKKRNRATGPKDKRRRSSAAEHYDNIEDDDDDDDDEDGGESEDSSWHYDGEKCDAPHCKRPKTKRVSWVQCDDCDDWYHTQCAGCRYNKVKKANAEFHCGCLEKA